MKKAVVWIFVLLFTLSGCTKYPYTVQPVLDDAVATQTVSNRVIQVSYPASYMASVGEDSISLLFTTGYAGAAVVQRVDDTDLSIPLTEGDGKWLQEKLTEFFLGYATYTVVELQTIQDETVIYMESMEQYTEEVIDNMLAAGSLTEETIEAVGGREAMLAFAPTPKISIFAYVEGELFSFSGSYEMEDGNEGRQALLDCLTLMITTAEKK